MWFIVFKPCAWFAETLCKINTIYKSKLHLFFSSTPIVCIEKNWKKIMSDNHPGSRKVKKVVKQAWSDETMNNAIKKLQTVPSVSIRGVAKEFGLSECTLRFRLAKAKKGEGLKKSGRKCTFTPELEAELANCISVVCNLS